MAPWLMGCIAIYAFFLQGDDSAVGISLTLMVVSLLACASSVILTERTEVRDVASSMTLVAAMSLFVVLLPHSTNVYVDSALVVAVAAASTLLYIHRVDLPYIGPLLVGRSTMLIIIFLPILLAGIQAACLGLRFWESFHMGRMTVLLVPLIAVWGFVEEALFRGILLRSSVPLLGPAGAVVLSAVANAAFMLFWGSLPFAIFSLAMGGLMGLLYMRTRSLMFVGTVHALTDTWMVIAFLLVGSTAF